MDIYINKCVSYDGWEKISYNSILGLLITNVFKATTEKGKVNLSFSQPNTYSYDPLKGLSREMVPF